MTHLSTPVTRTVDFGRGPVNVTLSIEADVPIITFRHKRGRESWSLPIGAVYAQAVARSVERGRT